jgi:Predicted hydrolase (metallo-beta-lactamase superfamily)
MDIQNIGYEIDFLSVGEGERSGDAIVMRWGNIQSNAPRQQTVVVIDGGFKANGNNIVSHIKRYYKTDVVNLVISTHPHADHIGGLETVVNEMKVDTLAIHQPWLTSHTNGIARMFQNGRVTDKSVRQRLRDGLDVAFSLVETAKGKGVNVCEPFTGGNLDSNGGRLEILGPSERFYESLLPQFSSTPNPINQMQTRTYHAQKQISVEYEDINRETLDDAGETSPENDTSVISMLTVAGRQLLFTGDAGQPALRDAIQNNTCLKGKFSFIQIPHHGSVHNVSPYILDVLVGSKRSYEENLTTRNGHYGVHDQHESTAGSSRLSSLSSSRDGRWCRDRRPLAVFRSPRQNPRLPVSSPVCYAFFR